MYSTLNEKIAELHHALSIKQIYSNFWHTITGWYTEDIRQELALELATVVKEGEGSKTDEL
jgi:hypothetical protein